ncbi:13314_t:CDS:2, partial [Gigaspora margarita]
IIHKHLKIAVNWIESKINEGEINEFKLEQFEGFKRISAGAFSTVYKAIQRNTKIIYALKMIENNANINKELVNEVGDQLDPSVIKYVLVLSYADGGTLRDYLQNNATRIG